MDWNNNGILLAQWLKLRNNNKSKSRIKILLQNLKNKIPRVWVAKGKRLRKEQEGVILREIYKKLQIAEMKIWNLSIIINRIRTSGENIHKIHSNM